LSEELKNLTKEQLLFLHLLKYNHQQNEWIVSEFITEQGIQNELKCTLGFISQLLKKNEDDGYIYRTKSKLIKSKRKQNTFFLTNEGMKLAIEINNMISKSDIK
jgi:DNA-binding MarR family transcriptional regulator